MDGIFISRPDGSSQHGVHPIPSPGPGLELVHPDWSPDGSQIVFIAKEPEALWIMNSDGTHARQIVPGSSECCGQDHPYWSPDGKSIAFIRWVGTEASNSSLLEVYDLATGSIRTVTRVHSPDILDQPHWSPDSMTLAVEMSRRKTNGDCCEPGAIGLVDVKTGKQRVLTDAVPFAGVPDWRPDGQAIVFDSHGLSYAESNLPTEATNLYSISLDGTGLQQLTHNPAGGVRSTQPFWMADGTIGYVEAEAEQSFNRFVRFISPDGLQLPDPSPRIGGTHPHATRTGVAN